MTSPIVVFRADASLDIGTGHVMRCLTLANALRNEGARCVFISREHPGNLLSLIRDQGFEALALPRESSVQPENVEKKSSHAAWLGTSWAKDAQQTIAVLGPESIEWLVVDHYALDARWESALKGMSKKLLVIDDLADREHDCDLLLDQNLGRISEHYAHLVPVRCKVLIGPKFALLRPEFAESRPYSLNRRKAAALKHLLISMGGVDKGNATALLLDSLLDCELPKDCRITVVMGPHAPWLAEVQERAERMPWPTEVRVGVSNMASLMAESDLAIGAAGTTAWERCCIGLPTLTMVLADNQCDGATALEATGSILIIGANVKHELKEIFSDSALTEKLCQLRDASSQITEGNGAKIISNILIAHNV